MYENAHVYTRPSLMRIKEKSKQDMSQYQQDATRSLFSMLSALCCREIWLPFISGKTNSSSNICHHVSLINICCHLLVRNICYHLSVTNISNLWSSLGLCRLHSPHVNCLYNDADEIRSSHQSGATVSPRLHHSCISCII